MLIFELINIDFITKLIKKYFRLKTVAHGNPKFVSLFREKSLVLAKLAKWNEGRG